MKKDLPTALSHPRRLPLTEHPLTERDRAIQRAGGFEPQCRRFTLGECSVILGRGPQGWHLSIAHEKRYPTWDEIVEARYRLVPSGSEMAMILPTLDTWINEHPNCFHLWECVTPGDWGAVRIGGAS
jgi:hypothetical protein